MPDPMVLQGPHPPPPWAAARTAAPADAAGQAVACAAFAAWVAMASISGGDKQS
jgi:hypothetical protein